MHKSHPPQNLKTPGLTPFSFHHDQALFRVNSEVPLREALSHASNLLHLAKLLAENDEGNLTAEQVKAFCRDNLTGYKRPRRIEFCAELPKNPVGKVLRRQLRDADSCQSGAGQAQ